MTKNQKNEVAIIKEVTLNEIKRVLSSWGAVPDIRLRISTQKTIVTHTLNYIFTAILHIMNTVEQLLLTNNHTKHELPV